MNLSESADGPPIFIDRNSGGKTLREILRLAGLKFILHDDIFTEKTTDLEWLQGAAERGYVVVTGDQDCMRRFLFIEALSKSKAYVFVLSGLNGATAEGKAQCILAAQKTMLGIMAKHPAPAIWKVYDHLPPKRLDHASVLARMFKSNRRP